MAKSTYILFSQYLVSKGLTTFSLVILIFSCSSIIAQDYEIHKDIKGAVIYDYDPVTKLGDDIFGTIIADFSDPANGELRNSHGGPVCMEFANGTLIAFYTNTSGHNIDGWSEYALSKDKGRSWDKYNPFPCSFKAYQKDTKYPVLVEEGLITEQGTAVLFLTHFENITEQKRIRNSIMRSYDNGGTWSEPEPFIEGMAGYPAAVSVSGSVNYLLIDRENDDNKYHELYVSTDDGKTWIKRSTLPLQEDAWYGALCVMRDGGLLAGAYISGDENHLYYCISKDVGFTWSKQEKAYLDKKVRDPELAYLNGKYYLHGRSGHQGEGRHRFVLYQSNNGIKWREGVIISGDERKTDGYSHNCIINRFESTLPKELMILYSIAYNPPRTSEYVFFIKPKTRKGCM